MEWYRIFATWVDQLNTPTTYWPRECRDAPHMALRKAPGDELNKHIRPIKTLTVLLRVRAKFLTSYLRGKFATRE